MSITQKRVALILAAGLIGASLMAQAPAAQPTGQQVERKGERVERRGETQERKGGRQEKRGERNER